MKIKLTIPHDNGDEHVESVPAKHEVCDECEGHGTILNPAIGRYAYSQEEFEASFPDDESKAQYFTRGGIYDVKCPGCNGMRVIVVPNEEAASKREKRVIRRWRKEKERRARWASEARREWQTQEMMGGCYEGAYC